MSTVRGIISKLVRVGGRAYCKLALRLLDAPLILANRGWYARWVGMDVVLRSLGATVGRRCNIDPDIRIWNDQNGRCDRLRIGDHVYVGPGVTFELASRIVVEDEATISGLACIVTHFDVGNRPLQARLPRQEGPVTIERGAYIGTGAVILHGVTVGACTVVGAMSLVNRDLPPDSVCVGIPCKTIRSLETPKPRSEP